MISAPKNKEVDNPKRIKRIPYVIVAAKTSKPFEFTFERKTTKKDPAIAPIELNAVRIDITAAPPLKSLSAISGIICL